MAKSAENWKKLPKNAENCRKLHKKAENCPKMQKIAKISRNPRKKSQNKHGAV